MEFFDINRLGSYASLISLAVSIITLYLIRNIKKSYQLKERIKDIEKKLKNSSSKISSFLNDYESNNEEILNEMLSIKIILRTLCSKSSNPLKSDASIAIKMIRNYNFKNYFPIKIFKPNEKSARNIYSQLNNVIEEINNVKIDLGWDVKNG